MLILVFLGLWFGSSFLLDAWNGLDKESQLEKLSELGKPVDSPKIIDPEKMSGMELQSQPEMPPAMVESTDQAEISLEQEPGELPEPAAFQNNEAEKDNLSGRTNIMISPIEINE